jgi:hypothetical protein
MGIPEPNQQPMDCPRCGGEAKFVIPYVMLFLEERELTELEAAMKRYPHRLDLEKLRDRQVLWYYPDLYQGPWSGWHARYGVCVCNDCGLRRKHDTMP